MGLNSPEVSDTTLYTYLIFVGIRGFEPRTSCSQSRRATKLRYIPLYAGHPPAPGQPDTTGFLLPSPLPRMSYATRAILPLVSPRGLEPPRTPHLPVRHPVSISHTPQGWQSQRASLSATSSSLVRYYLACQEPETGFEPATSTLRRERSTAELFRHVLCSVKQCVDHIFGGNIWTQLCPADIDTSHELTSTHVDRLIENEYLIFPVPCIQYIHEPRYGFEP